MNMIRIDGFIWEIRDGGRAHKVSGFAFEIRGFEWMRLWATPLLGEPRLWTVSNWDDGAHFPGIHEDTPQQAARAAEEVLRRVGLEGARAAIKKAAEYRAAQVAEAHD